MNTHLQGMLREADRELYQVEGVIVTGPSVGLVMARRNDYPLAGRPYAVVAFETVADGTRFYSGTYDLDRMGALLTLFERARAEGRQE